jgi:hypothetical protein
LFSNVAEGANEKVNKLSIHYYLEKQCLFAFSVLPSIFLEGANGKVNKVYSLFPGKAKFVCLSSAAIYIFRGSQCKGKQTVFIITWKSNVCLPFQCCHLYF